MSLDKSSPIPLYYQLAELIKQQIEQELLLPGNQLPSERALSEQHGISRMTVRQAINYLITAGTLVAKHGLGTFVAELKLTYNALHLLGFTEELMRRGEQPTSQVLEHTTVTAPPQIAARLRLTPDSSAIKIVRLRLANTLPLLLETTYVPTSVCPSLRHEDMATRSLYEVLERQCGLTLSHAHQSLEATVANDYESELFGIMPGTPMILLEGVTLDAKSRPVEYFKAVYRGDRFKFTFESDRSVWLTDSSSEPRVKIVLAP